MSSAARSVPYGISVDRSAVKLVKTKIIEELPD